MSLIHLSTELRQELKLTPQLLQSMELLQMNSQELLDYLNQVSEENPLVERLICPPSTKPMRPCGRRSTGSMAACRRTATAPCRTGAPRTGRRRASPPSFATSWSAGACPSPCWP